MGKLMNRYKQSALKTRLTGTGAIDSTHRLYTKLSLAELLNRNPNRLNPGFRRPAYYSPLEAKVRAAMANTKNRNPNVTPAARRAMRRPTRR